MKYSLLFAGLLALAAEPAKPLPEVQALKLENLVLREELATQQLAKIRAQQQDLYAEVCKAAGIEIAECAVDLNKRLVLRKPLAPTPVSEKMPDKK